MGLHVEARAGTEQAHLTWPGEKSYLVPDGREVDELAGARFDVLGSLEALVETVGAVTHTTVVAGVRAPGAPAGRGHRRLGLHGDCGPPAGGRRLSPTSPRARA